MFEKKRNLKTTALKVLCLDSHRPSAGFPRVCKKVRYCDCRHIVENL